ncbi:PAP2 family protein [Aurantiacibacter xanthus]|uniref:PAP2 family protein n=1 Tax=Aurantiacibacter xanthus TaxID=1784712 RepID=A0A3A1P6U5_9SPHN|nr:phosphatase PAP2 family protein [Aurantiacibacter xanthus]RIV89524.1 PAP2 family protein [Aurantiacibacter xanthus]
MLIDPRRWLFREQRFLALFLLGAALVAGFVALAGEMQEGETHAFDIAILKALRVPGDPAHLIGPGWLQTVATDITALGGVTVLTLVSLLAIAFLLLRGRWRQAGFTVLATLGGAVMGHLLKGLFARSRPEAVPHLVEVTSLSFPSGHSLNSAIVYLTLAVMIARSFTDRTSRVFTVAVAVLLVLAIGCTRVLLGVHYPTDVLGGWTLGAAWALLVGVVADVLQKQHRIEEPSNGQGEAKAPPHDSSA